MALVDLANKRGGKDNDDALDRRRCVLVDLELAEELPVVELEVDADLH